MIKYVIEIVDSKIEFRTLAAAQEYLVANNIDVQINEIDDVLATDQKPKIYPIITRKQAKKAMVLSGIALESIDTAINSMQEPQRTLAMIEWQDSSVLERDHEMVQMIGQMIGLSKEQIDAMWDLAITL